MCVQEGGSCYFFLGGWRVLIHPIPRPSHRVFSLRLHLRGLNGRRDLWACTVCTVTHVGFSVGTVRRGHLPGFPLYPPFTTSLDPHPSTAVPPTLEQTQRCPPLYKPLSPPPCHDSDTHERSLRQTDTTCRESCLHRRPRLILQGLR